MQGQQKEMAVQIIEFSEQLYVFGFTTTAI